MVPIPCFHGSVFISDPSALFPTCQLAGRWGLSGRAGASGVGASDQEKSLLSEPFLLGKTGMLVTMVQGRSEMVFV